MSSPALIVLLASLQLVFDVALAQIPSVLPQQDYDVLQAVGKRVKSLRRPSQQLEPNVVLTNPTLIPCSLVAGFATVNLSTTCCTSARVIMQRRLASYGIAPTCAHGWQCERDGVTPIAAFEAQSLEAFCSEAMCLPEAARAMQSNLMTQPGAIGMNYICKSLGSLTPPSGKVDRVEAITGLLHKTDAISKSWSNWDPAENLECQEEVCGGDGEEDKKTFCANHDSSDKCFEYCCEGGPACFPGDSTLNVKGIGQVPMVDVKIGHQVLVERHGGIAYEPVLAFLHTIPHVPGRTSSFIVVVHENGIFRASESHIIFVLDAEGMKISKQAIQLGVGDQLLMSFMESDQQLGSSRILELRRGSGKSGMYAPWTDSGSIVVDGVVASTYASPSVKQDLSHDLAHAFHFPLRVYHAIGLPIWLQPLWESGCSYKPEIHRHWICQGGNPAPKAIVEEMHPYINLAFRTLHLDWFLR